MTASTASNRALSLVIGSLICGFALSCASGRPPTPVGPLVINPAALPAAVINVPYSATLTAVGGQQPFTWALASGALPPGLGISTSGVISGTPTTLGTTNFKVSVTDSQTPTAAVDIVGESITVNATLSITTSSLAAGSVNVPYSAALAAGGGVPPYTWSVTSGSLPAGLTLSTGGVISGTPTSQQTSTFTVQVSDSQTPATTATATLSLTINGPTFRLNGNYVFSFSGYSQGKLVLQAGSFTSDGHGNISNGLMDSNSATGVHTSLPFTGTYSLDATNTGPMTLVIPALGTFTYPVGSTGLRNDPLHSEWQRRWSGDRRHPPGVDCDATLPSVRLPQPGLLVPSEAMWLVSRYAAAGTFVAGKHRRLDQWR